MKLIAVYGEGLPDAHQDDHNQSDDQNSKCASMEDSVWSRPAEPWMLRPYYALDEEPVYHEQDDSPNVDEDIRRNTKTDVSWVACPCYSQGHCDDPNLA